jgi:hypothetical protein
MTLLSRVGGTVGPVGRKYTNPLSFATGGATQTYTKGGNTWQSHTFTGSGQFVVVSNSQPFTVLVVGGGQGGGYDHPADTRYNGASGGAVVSTSITPTIGTVNVTVGGGGGGGQGTHESGGPGGLSSFGAYLSSSGGGGVTTDVQTGTNVSYANSTYGAGGPVGYLTPGGSGRSGVVIIAYRLS